MLVLVNRSTNKRNKRKKTPSLCAVKDTTAAATVTVTVAVIVIVVANNAVRRALRAPRAVTENV